MEAPDTGDYIDMAKLFLGKIESMPDYSARSPLYPLFISVLMLVFNSTNVYGIAIFFNYLFIFLTSLLLFNIFKTIIPNHTVVFLISGLYLLNLSTITFGFYIVSETLTTLLFILITYLLIRYLDNQKFVIIIPLGLITGLSILARYNLMMLPVFIILILILNNLLLTKKIRIKLLVRDTIIFVISTFFILNLWCLRNYYTNGSYMLMPGSVLNRNSALSTLNHNNKVTPKYDTTLSIFLSAKDRVYNMQSQINKGSFISYDNFKYLQKLHSGFEIYSEALPDLMKHYNCNSNNYITVLSDSLAPFYEQISEQNKTDILALRILSVLNGFRYSIGALPESAGKTNLNILPGIFFKAYKIFFVVAVLIFLVFTVIYIIRLIGKKNVDTPAVLICLILIIHFPVVNFLGNTMSEANRYKFPSEPLIIGLAVYYLYSFWKRKSESKM